LILQWRETFAVVQTWDRRSEDWAGEVKAQMSKGMENAEEYLKVAENSKSGLEGV
jgi:hypothetical protein